SQESSQPEESEESQESSQPEESEESQESSQPEESEESQESSQPEEPEESDQSQESSQPKEPEESDQPPYNLGSLKKVKNDISKLIQRSKKNIECLKDLLDLPPESVPSGELIQKALKSVKDLKKMDFPTLPYAKPSGLAKECRQTLGDLKAPLVFPPADGPIE
ncbi:putative adherence-associated mucus-binding protein, partial [Mitosporidium daphniae]